VKIIAGLQLKAFGDTLDRGLAAASRAGEQLNHRLKAHILDDAHLT